MNKKIIFTTGGTGGHILPAINLMEHFKSKGYDVLLVTDKRGAIFLKEYPALRSYILKADTPTNKNLFKKFLSLFTIIYTIIKSANILNKEKPDLIFGFGGYVSFPISFASKFFKIPLIIYENNLVLGRANKFLLSIAKKILLAKIIDNDLLKKYNNKTYLVGAVLNKEIINYSESLRSKNKKNFSILVLGGSQGAEIFGDIIPKTIKMIKDNKIEIEINQQCTKNQKIEITKFYSNNNIKNNIFEFEKNIIKLIMSSDLAITRCGASSTSELVHTLTPFIGVPLPQSIDNHQFLNAKYYERIGCCWILEQKNFNSKTLYNLIINIIENKNKLKNIQENMKKNINKNVYIDIENQVKEFI